MKRKSRFLGLHAILALATLSLAAPAAFAQESEDLPAPGPAAKAAPSASPKKSATTEPKSTAPLPRAANSKSAAPVPKSGGDSRSVARAGAKTATKKKSSIHIGSRGRPSTKIVTRRNYGPVQSYYSTNTTLYPGLGRVGVGPLGFGAGYPSVYYRGPVYFSPYANLQPSYSYYGGLGYGYGFGLGSLSYSGWGGYWPSASYAAYPWGAGPLSSYGYGYTGLGYGAIGYGALGYSGVGYSGLGYSGLGYFGQGFGGLGFGGLGYGYLAPRFGGCYHW